LKRDRTSWRAASIQPAIAEFLYLARPMHPCEEQKIKAPRITGVYLRRIHGGITRRVEVAGHVLGLPSVDETGTVKELELAIRSLGSAGEKTDAKSFIRSLRQYRGESRKFAPLRPGATWCCR